MYCRHGELEHCLDAKESLKYLFQGVSSLLHELDPVESPGELKIMIVSFYFIFKTILFCSFRQICFLIFFFLQDYNFMYRKSRLPFSID